MASFKSLQQQIPLLYVAALVNLIGLHIATRGQELVLVSPASILTALLTWRMVIWTFFQKDYDNLDVISHQLVKMVALTVFLCVGFSIWTQVLISKHPDETMTILLFSVLATLGAAYGLSSFPRVAMLPLAILSLPMATRLLFMDNATTMGIGISLLLVLLLLMRLLHAHSRVLSALISSRLAVAKEHNRAISAEVAALKRADRDALTRIANREKLFREMQSNMVQGPSSGGGSVLAISDLDGFKAANDAFGHAAGDAILQAFATRLSDAFGSEATIARIGGDEFAVFWRHGLCKESIAEIGTQICSLASHPVEWDGKSLTIGTSCGITEAGPISSSVSEFLRQADSALYRAKAAGRGVWQLYDHEMYASDKRRAALENMLLDHKARLEMSVEFQPIICLTSGKVVSAEALARWNSVELGTIHPSEFIFVAEQLGIIEEVNEALLRTAINAVRPWPVNLRLSFNLSALQISQEGSAAKTLDLLEQQGFSASCVQFEVTETTFPSDMARAKRELQKLRDAGCIIALDDFGAGHASVSYLRDLVFDVIKLDGSLTTNIQQCERSRRIVLGLIELCHASGAKCVAEHVETKEQLSLIRAMGCDYAQGYHLGRPASPAHVFGVMPDSVAIAQSRPGYNVLP